MKKLFTVSILAMLVFALNLTAADIKAKEGESTALGKVTIQTPELLLVGAMNQSLQGLPVPLTFDLATGAANGWLYFYKQTGGDSKQVIAVTKLLGPMVGIEIPVANVIPELPYEPTTSLSAVTWIDSDVMSQNVRNNNDYKTFIAANPTVKPSIITLSVGVSLPNLTITDPYWILKFEPTGGSAYYCAVNAISSETSCFSEPVNGVNENNENGLSVSVSPNPASDIAIIRVPKELQSAKSEMYLFDFSGLQLLKINLNGVNELYYLPLCDFANGAYFIKYIEQNNSQTKMFVIQR
ncbi:MAG: T9SS type A sorting domain-containing protein [Bacteroidota bacterium]